MNYQGRGSKFPFSFTAQNSIQRLIYEEINLLKMKTKSNGLILLGILTVLIGTPILCKKAYRRGRKYLVDKVWEKLNDEKRYMSLDLYNEVMDRLTQEAIKERRRITYIPIQSKEDLEKMQNYELLATLDNICDVVGSVEWLKKEEEARK